MHSLLNHPENLLSRHTMDQMTPEEREYEALSTIRDITALLYREINENTGKECELLLSAFEQLTFLVDRAEKNL